MLRVLVVEATVFGYDGISGVITNYFTYIDPKKIHMDLVTINPVFGGLKDILERNKEKNYVLSCRNSNPLKYVLQLAMILKQGQYSIIHAHGCSATMAVEMLAAKLAGVKVRIAHSHNKNCDHKTLNRLLHPLFDVLCNVRFACGKEAGEWLFPNKSFTIIVNGIDLERYQYNETVRGEIRAKYGLEGKNVIGHVGRFSEAKNHKKLIEIYKTYSQDRKNTELVMVGDGELRREIGNIAETEKLNVLFTGISDEVDKWLQAFDVIVFPSLFEGIPLVLIEAQAAGLPCVLSDTVPEEVKLTDLVEFVRSESSLKEWGVCIDELLSKTDRAAQKDEIMAKIQESCLDIRGNCHILEEKYTELVREIQQ